MLSQCNSGMQCPPLPKRIKRTRLQESGRNKFIQDLGGEESHCRSLLTFPQRRPHTPTPTPTIQKMENHNKNCTEGLRANTTFPPAAVPTSPTDNSGHTPPHMPPTDNTGDVRHQGPAT